MDNYIFLCLGGSLNTKGLTTSQSTEKTINSEQSRGLFGMNHGYHRFPGCSEAALKMAASLHPGLCLCFVFLELTLNILEGYKKFEK